MAYVRKTTDEYHILIDYGYGDGWEHECTEETWKDAKKQHECYLSNTPFPVKIETRRVRKKSTL